MGSIGTVTFDIIRGLTPAMKTRTETWEVPGIQGYGALRLGEGDAAFELVAVLYCADNATAQTQKGYIENLQGTVVDVTDDFGDTYNGIVVKHVDVTKTPRIWNGHADARRLEARFQLCTSG